MRGNVCQPSGGHGGPLSALGRVDPGLVVLVVWQRDTHEGPPSPQRGDRAGGACAAVAAATMEAGCQSEVVLPQRSASARLLRYKYHMNALRQ